QSLFHNPQPPQCEQPAKPTRPTALTTMARILGRMAFPFVQRSTARRRVSVPWESIADGERKTNATKPCPDRQGDRVALPPPPPAGFMGRIAGIAEDRVKRLKRSHCAASSRRAVGFPEHDASVAPK